MLRERLTEGVEIALMEARHAEAMYAFAEKGRDEFVKWIPFVGRTRDIHEIERVIKTFLDKLAAGTGYLFGLWVAERMVGLVLVREIDETSRWAEIGYMVDAEFEGKGLMKAACGILVSRLFGQRDMRKIVICCDPRNERSVGLAKSLGFTLEGTLRKHSFVNGELRDLMHWGLLREEYEASARGSSPGS